MEQERYTFNMQTPQGTMQFQVPKEEMKVCSCGHDLFEMHHRVTWVKPDLVTFHCLKVDIFTCARCGEELTPKHQSIRQAKEKELLQP